MNIKLYIKNELVDLSSGNNLVLLNYQRTDYTNPTSIKNSYSKTVTLPGTENNNRIFNSIYQLDYRQTTNIFNPSKRVPFELYYAEGLFEKGYIKLETINRSKDYISYEITLYGGLGGLIYGLTYDDDVELGLDDLTFEYTLDYTINKDTIHSAWESLRNGTNDVYQTLNWMVAYNGTPSNFEADKVLVLPGNYRDKLFWYDGEEVTGLPVSKTVEEVEYGLSSGGFALMTAPRDMTDIEMRDLRSYLQRPVLRLKKLIEAIARYAQTNLGYTFDLTDSFFSSSDYTDTWITLAIPEEKYSGDTITQEELLSDMGTPADYLVSLCKIFGLYITINSLDSTVVLTRHFFQDITENIEILKDYSITPLSFDTNVYVFNYQDGTSEFMDKYENTYGYKYGIKRVLTGYEFDSDSQDYIENNVFIQGCDALESSEYYQYTGYPHLLEPHYTRTKYTDVSYTLWDSSGNEYSASIGRRGSWSSFVGKLTADPTLKYQGTFSTTSDYYDVYPRLQFHTDDNSSSEGSKVLVKFTEFKKPYTASMSFSFVWSVEEGPAFAVTDDHPDMDTVAGGKCWYGLNAISRSLTQYAVWESTIPAFTRGTYSIDENYNITETLDFGKSKEVPIAYCIYNGTDLYEKYWDSMISDLYDVNTRILECKSRIINPHTAFNRFYWYDNSLWILSEISDYNLDSYWCKCKFIRVNDKNNYL